MSNSAWPKPPSGQYPPKPASPRPRPVGTGL